MYSTGVKGRIQVTRKVYERTYDVFKFEERRGVSVKGKGTMVTYLVSSKKKTKTEEKISPLQK
jgi:hypothetical protein